MRARRAVGALAACVLLLAASVHAQDRLSELLGTANRTPPSASPITPLPLTGPIDPAEYVVGPGDVLSVHIGGGVTRNWDVWVSPEGSIYVPSVGDIAVSGLTLLEARRVVVQRIAKDYRGVDIELRLTRTRLMLVTLAGQTRKHGAIEVGATNRASQVLVDSLFGERSSLRNIEIRRQTPQGEKRIPVDLVWARLTGRSQRDPLLHDGDVLFVPVATTHFGLEGAVGRPGYFELAPGDSLSTLFALCGGVLGESIDEALLVHFLDATHTDSLTFRVSEVLAGRFNIPMRDGDRVFVRYQPHYHQIERASILGEVQQPGGYPLAPGQTRLSGLVAAAGGFLPGADLTALRVYRANPPGGEADPEIGRLAPLSRKEMTASEYEVLRARLTARRADYRIDWNRLHGDRELDLLLLDGDVVSVDPVSATVRVEGEVRRPGLIRFEAGRKVSAYVRLAGGFSARAARSQVRITRAVTGQTVLARDASALSPGDLVWVPERGETATWQHLEAILLVLAQIATVIVAVRR